MFKIYRKRQELKINLLWGGIILYVFKPLVWQLNLFSLPIVSYYNYISLGKRYKGLVLFSSPKIKDYVRQDCLFHITRQALPGFRNIVYIRSGLGETYLLNLYMKQILNRLNLSDKDTCFVGTRDNFNELFRQYHPDLTYKKIMVNFDYLSYAINAQSYQFNGKNIYFYIEKNFIYQLMDQYKEQSTTEHYVSCICNFFMIPEKEHYEQTYQPTLSDGEQAIRYLRENNVDINNFVFISKDAISVEPFSVAFWNDLEHGVEMKGYDIVYNSSRISISMAKAIAYYSKVIIALRSGFLETISDLNKNYHVLYSKFRLNGMKADIVRKTHSLKYYPNVNPNNIFEYDLEYKNEAEILTEILERL